jgi:F-box-like
MSHESQDSDLLEITRLMGEMSLGGCDSWENQRDIPRSSDMMQSVPDDVLREIFQAGTSGTSGTSDTSMCRYSVDDLPMLPFPHLVSIVNRRWRDVALCSPYLWTTIVFNCNRTMSNHEGPSLWIERSGACLLDITIVITLWGSLSNVKSAMDQIIPHTTRWRRFTVDCLSRNMVETVIARLHPASVPHLRDFIMISYDDDSLGYIRTTDVTARVCDRLFTGGATSLTEARLIGPYHIYTPPLTGLTYLQLGGSYRANKIVRITANRLRDLLTASPFLNDLVLQHLDVIFPLNTSVSDIQIPSLCSLTMSFSYRAHRLWKLFSLLSLPELKTLILTHMSQLGAPCIDIGLQSYAAVTALRLVQCGSIQHSLAKSLYSSFPSIIHLELIKSSGLVKEHLLQNNSYVAVIWPHLKTITISYPMRYETICDFIDNRREMGHPLGTINVWSRIRQKIEGLTLDDESKSNFRYPAGLKSAMKEVKDEEYEARWKEDNVTCSS